MNPYDVARVAGSIATALEMKPEEQAERMQGMRKVVKEHKRVPMGGQSPLGADRYPQ